MNKTREEIEYDRLRRIRAACDRFFDRSVTTDATFRRADARTQCYLRELCREFHMRGWEMCRVGAAGNGKQPDGMATANGAYVRPIGAGLSTPPG